MDRARRRVRRAAAVPDGARRRAGDEPVLPRREGRRPRQGHDEPDPRLPLLPRRHLLLPVHKSARAGHVPERGARLPGVLRPSLRLHQHELLHLDRQGPRARGHELAQQAVRLLRPADDLLQLLVHRPPRRNQRRAHRARLGALQDMGRGALWHAAHDADEDHPVQGISQRRARLAVDGPLSAGPTPPAGAADYEFNCLHCRCAQPQPRPQSIAFKIH
mmetsp:Transcript_30968/g.99042  ORF Transcript_30968/g.99042 Transcript_30968/m.99042 type:complete len:218 (+) Transcript_30968:392-1045(+)